LKRQSISLALLNYKNDNIFDTKLFTHKGNQQIQQEELLHLGVPTNPIEEVITDKISCTIK